MQHRLWVRKSDNLAPDLERAAPRAPSSGPTYLDKTPNLDSVATYTRCIGQCCMLYGTNLVIEVVFDAKSG